MRALFALALCAASAAHGENTLQADVPDSRTLSCDFTITVNGSAVTHNVPAVNGQCTDIGGVAFVPLCSVIAVSAVARAASDVSAPATATFNKPCASQGVNARVVAAPAAPPPPPPTNVSLWATTPTVTDGGADTPVTLGVRLSASVPGQIIALKFYKLAGNTGTHTAGVWSNTGVLLASATFSGETASGWQTVNLATPLRLTPGTSYVVGYLSSVGHYAFTTSFFGSPFTSGVLTATAGLFSYGTPLRVPTSTFQNGNYWVDVVFRTD